MDLIKIALWLGTYNDLVYLILGGMAGLLFGHFSKTVKVPVHGRGREIQYEYRRRPDLRNIVLGIIIVAFSFTLSKINGSYTEIPDVAGLTYEEASARLHLAGLSCTEDYGHYGDVVTGISPSAEYARFGSIIELTLGRQEAADGSVEAAAPQAYEAMMPDVYMVQEEAALTYLRVAGFTNIKVLPQYTDTTVAGYVLRSEPFSGEMMDYDDPVVLYVSVNEVQG